MNELEHKQPLAERFQRLRAAEASSAPALVIPNEPGSTVVPMRRAPFIPFTAAAAAVVLGITLLLQPGTEDPAQMYLNIIERQSWSSDALLDVGEGILPALKAQPDLYQIDFEFDFDSF